MNFYYMNNEIQVQTPEIQTPHQGPTGTFEFPLLPSLSGVRISFSDQAHSILRDTVQAIPCAWYAFPLDSQSSSQNSISTHGPAHPVRHSLSHFPALLISQHLSHCMLPFSVFSLVVHPLLCKGRTFSVLSNHIIRA